MVGHSRKRDRPGEKGGGMLVNANGVAARWFPKTKGRRRQRRTKISKTRMEHADKARERRRGEGEKRRASDGKYPFTG